MKVRALSQGFYNGRHIDPGTVFELVRKTDYAGREDPILGKFGWMEKVVDPPDRKSTQPSKPSTTTVESEATHE